MIFETLILSRRVVEAAGGRVPVPIIACRIRERRTRVEAIRTELRRLGSDDSGKQPYLSSEESMILGIRQGTSCPVPTVT